MLKAILNSIGSAVLATDIQGRIVYFNHHGSRNQHSGVIPNRDRKGEIPCWISKEPLQ